MIDGQGAAAAVFLDSELLMLLAARARMTGELVDHGEEVQEEGVLGEVGLPISMSSPSQKLARTTEATTSSFG